MEERLPRKLAAILYADVAGYSRLTVEDEEGTHRRLSEYLDFISASIEQHQGKVVHYAGDAVLADFGTVTDALTCAAAVQRDLQERNKDLRDERKVRFRIGVNLGEVIVDRDDIYGDGVNIAARLESLAEPGGICISGTVYDAIGNKVLFDFQDIGEQTVKNIEKPVRAYRVLFKGDVTPEDSSVETLPHESRSKPSIAVLPFTNLSGDPEQEYFSDGIAEDITTNLSRFPDLFVIGRHSTFSYKGKSATVQQVGRELGVRYVLEGSVQRSRNTVRITAQLVDAMTSHHLWAERYDRELKEIFSVRDDVTQSIVATLMGDSGKLTKAEIERALSKAPENLDAYDYQLRGIQFLNRMTKEANAEAGRMFRKAIELDPEYPSPYQGLAWAYLEDVRHEWSENPKKDIERAYELAKKALELDDSDYANHWALGIGHLYRRQHDQAIAAYEKAQLINPNDADLIANMATPLTYAGRAKEGIDHIQRAMRLNPLHPDWYTYVLGWVYAEAGQHEEAVTMFSKVANPPKWISYVLAASYAQLGWMEKATTEVEKILHSEPNFSLKAYAEYLKETQPYKNSEMLEWFLKALRKAGFPE